MCFHQFPKVLDQRICNDQRLGIRQIMLFLSNFFVFFAKMCKTQKQRDFNKGLECTATKC